MARFVVRVRSHPMDDRFLDREARARALLLAPLLLFTACRTRDPLPAELRERIDAEAWGLSPLDDDDGVREAGEALAAGRLAWPEPVPLPEGTTLHDYVALALERSPRLRARVRDLQALGLRVPQVTSLPDPSVSWSTPIGGGTQTAAGEVDGAFGVSQGLPLTAKLHRKGEIAEQVVRVALENLRAERLAVVRETKDAYFAYYLATVSEVVTEENLRLLERLREVAKAKYSAGTAPQQDLLRAEVEVYGVSNDLITLEQRRRSAVARLNVLLDRDVLAGLPEPIAPEPRDLGAEVSTMLAEAAEHNPRLAALREAARAELLEVELARLQKWPDLGLGMLWTIVSGTGLSPVADGEDVLGLTLGLNLPLWRGKLRAAVLERNARVLQAVEHYRGERNSVFFAVQDLLSRVDAAYRQAVLLRDGILPRARQTVEVSESGYRAGDLDFTTLIDNWQRLLDLTLSYHEALANLERQVAALEEALGGAIEHTSPETSR